MKPSCFIGISFRVVFLDEFVDDLDVSGDQSIDATVGLAKAEELYHGTGSIAMSSLS